jgi:hypothetical protein
MNESEVKSFCVRTGARGGRIAAVVLCLAFWVPQIMLTGFLSTSWFGGSPEDWAAEGTRNLFIFLLGSLPLAAIMGSLGGATIGLSCHWIIRRGYPGLLTSLAGFIIGAVAGLLTLAVLVIGTLSLLAGYSHTGYLRSAYLWNCSPFTCAATGIAGLIVSRVIAREHP